MDVTCSVCSPLHLDLAFAGLDARQICGENNEYHNDEDYDYHGIGEDENDDEGLIMAVILNTAIVMMTWMVV